MILGFRFWGMVQDYYQMTRVDPVARVTEIEGEVVEILFIGGYHASTADDAYGKIYDLVRWCHGIEPR